MRTCDVLIVGGGPSGSSCAWKLSRAGKRVLVLDQQTFPRDKVCGGWITPPVLQALQIKPEEYATERVLQPITGFRTGIIGGVEVETKYQSTVSYGVRRCEFDHYLLRRCGAEVLDGTAFAGMRRSGREWVVNECVKASVVVGAGGHFCPVAKLLGAVLKRERVVAAREVEFELDKKQQDQCSIAGEIPELYFFSDLKGYGWCFRKHNFLNIGLGRLGNDGFKLHMEHFFEFLRAQGKIPWEIGRKLKGHAYLLYGITPRRLIGDGVLLAGDSAGLAYPLSGEGIRPAVESGLLAAEALLSAKGGFSSDGLQDYARALTHRFGQGNDAWHGKIAKLAPDWLTCSLGRALFRSRLFSRRVLLDHWFLHTEKPGTATYFSKGSAPTAAEARRAS